MKKASPQTGRVEVTSLHGLYMKTPPVVLLGGVIHSSNYVLLVDLIPYSQKFGC